MLPDDLTASLVADALYLRPRSLEAYSGPGGYAWRFDFREALGRSVILTPVAAHMAEMLDRMGIRQVAGRGFGSFPLLGAIAAIAPDISLGFVRERPKDYGGRKWVEGALDPSVPVAIVDDFINRGKNTAHTWQILLREGFRPSHALSVAAIGHQHRARILGGRLNPIVSLLEFAP